MPSDLPFGSKGNEESKAEKDITRRYWGQSLEGQDPTSNLSKSRGSQDGMEIKEGKFWKANKEMFEDDVDPGPDHLELSDSLREDDDLSSNDIASVKSSPNVHSYKHSNAGQARPYPPQVSFNLDTGSIGDPDKLP